MGALPIARHQARRCSDFEPGGFAGHIFTIESARLTCIFSFAVNHTTYTSGAYVSQPWLTCQDSFNARLSVLHQPLGVDSGDTDPSGAYVWQLPRATLFTGKRPCFWLPA